MLDRVRFNGLAHRMLRTPFVAKLQLIAGCLLKEDIFKFVEERKDDDKEKGKILRFDCRYCTASKRIREFGKRDPKQRVPKWCPKYRAQATLRIYCYRSSCAAYLCHMFSRENGSKPVIHEFDYAVRYEGTTSLTARLFEQQVKSVSLTELLGQNVHINEIIEIDDGVSSYCFYVGDWWRITCTHFDAEQARQNKLENEDETTERADEL